MTHVTRRDFLSRSGGLLVAGGAAGTLKPTPVAADNHAGPVKTLTLTADWLETTLDGTKVKLRANADGTLAGVFLGSRPLGNDSDAFKRLNIEILRLIGSPDNPLAEDMAVEIDADYNLHFRHVISAVGACTGRLDPRTQRVVKYIKNIKFKPPQNPAAAG